jgi:hypothetical protein
MSQQDPTGFGKFVPGFDFLQNLGKHASPTLGAINNWVAPTLDPQELEKRIAELKAVQFWLDQNATALKATIQALEVQKMTLATLKGMNLDMGAMAKSFQFPSQASPATAAKPAAKATPEPAAKTKPASKPRTKAADATASVAAVDPMQLWGALSQQFQQIATDAMQEVAKHAAAAPKAAKAASTAASPAAAPKAAKAAPKKPTRRAR